MSDTQQSAPSGWYDDGSGTKRWWDGDQWGDYAPPAPVVVNVQTPPEPRLIVNGAAVGGFILGLIALLTCWIPGVGVFFAAGGLIFSGVGLYLVKQRGGSGKGLASTGLVLSAVSVFVFFLMLLLTVQS